MPNLVLVLKTIFGGTKPSNFTPITAGQHEWFDRTSNNSSTGGCRPFQCHGARGLGQGVSEATLVAPAQFLRFGPGIARTEGCHVLNEFVWVPESVRAQCQGLHAAAKLGRKGGVTFRRPRSLPSTDQQQQRKIVARPQFTFGEQTTFLQPQVYVEESVSRKESLTKRQQQQPCTNVPRLFPSL